MFCNAIHAQLNISGTEYVLVGDLAAQYNTPRTDESFSDVNWAEVNAGDLTSIVRAFVRDATTHGAEMDLSDSRHFIGVVSSTNWNFRSTDPKRQPAATSVGSRDPGFSVDINEYWWNRSTNREKIELVYHELGHGLLHFDHVCDYAWRFDTNRVYTYFAIMKTGTCGSTIDDYNDVSSRYGEFFIEDLLDHFFYESPQLPPLYSRKGPDVIHN